MHRNAHARARARMRPRRQLCNIAAARTDLEKVTAIKAGHKAAVKELEALSHLETAVGMLDQIGGVPLDAARQAINLVLEAAPDCTRAQVAEAQMEFDARNFEQVRGLGGCDCCRLRREEQAVDAAAACSSSLRQQVLSMAGACCLVSRQPAQQPHAC